MNFIQRATFKIKISQAKSLFASGDLSAGFTHLERAHIIGQAYVLPHVTSHWLMLQYELRRRRPAAVFGPAVRIILDAMSSAVGVVFTGNTGGSNVSMLKRMPVENELQSIIDGRASGENARRSKLQETS